jgi:Zn-dependent M28 family amino/carboxypeptidase
MLCFMLSETMRAPGADDNGSGTSAMLEIASIIKNMHDTAHFKRGNLPIMTHRATSHTTP